MGKALDGQVVIVTGGARGQGRAFAVALAELGARLVVCDVPVPMTSVQYPLGTAEDLDETVARISQAGSTGLAVQADVRDAAAISKVAGAAIAEFGRIDILVANAGIVSTSRLWELSDEAWAEMIGTNLTGVFHALRAVVPHMRERGYGRIVVISSQGGRTGLPGISHYSAAKWGVIGLAKSLALEVAAEGITVNVVAPTTVRTPWLSMSRPSGSPARMACRSPRRSSGSASPATTRSPAPGSTRRTWPARLCTWSPSRGTSPAPSSRSA
ncbi:MAG TPA: SDR family NAD(P)-dependent oxidoreductase [Trebonia sp.]